jgi:hypothetical protein
MPPKDRNEIEDIELEWKRLQIEELREKLQNRRDEIARLERLRAKQLADFEKGQAELKRRQAVCRHRKGGRDNKFANGNDANYSIVRNVYPNGDTIIMCSRCFKDVRKPDRALRKSDPKLYAAQLAEWQEWDRYPTDNSPSGGKIFEIVPAA